MFTTVDKAIAAVLMGILSILVLAFPALQTFVTPETAQVVAGILTPLVVYLVPNRPT